MPRLTIDVDAEPWMVERTLALDRALGLPVDEPPSPEATIAYLLEPRRQPAEIEAPLHLTVSGNTPSAWMHRVRGASAVTDIIVSPEVASVLAGAVLPPHERIPVQAEVLGKGYARDARFPAPRPLVWIWWTVPWDDVDFASSTFALHRQDGSVEPVTFEEHADFEQVRRRGLRGRFVVIPTALVFRTTRDDGSFDLRPLGQGEWIVSAKLGEAIRDAGCPGVLMR